MALKRKLDDHVQEECRQPKQLKLAPLANFMIPSDSMDVDMSDSDPSPTSTYSPLPTSNSSDDGDESCPAYPTFQIYPSSFFQPPETFMTTVDMDANSVPLTKPFIHQRSDCSQIPKLRLACTTGMEGRSMWMLCEQCGAIKMVD